MEGTNTWGNSSSGPFAPEELAAALRHLKPEKSQGLDSIFPEFTLHAGSAFKPWFAISSLSACANSISPVS